MTDLENCLNCKFSDVQKDTATCRRYAPKPVLYAFIYQADKVYQEGKDDGVGECDFDAGWPRVLLTDWCGEFESQLTELKP